MSVDALKEFGKKCITDEGVKAKVKAIGLKDLSGLISYAKEQGFDFSEDDMKAVAKEAQASDELSEADLENVAGGVFTSTAASVVGAVVGQTAGVGIVSSSSSVVSTSSGSGW